MKKSKKKRVNFKNIWLMVVFLCSCGLIIHDTYMLMVMRMQFTMFGLITYGIAFYWAVSLGEYFYERIQ